MNDDVSHGEFFVVPFFRTSNARRLICHNDNHTFCWTTCSALMKISWKIAFLQWVWPQWRRSQRTDNFGDRFSWKFSCVWEQPFFIRLLHRRLDAPMLQNSLTSLLWTALQTYTVSRACKKRSWIDRSKEYDRNNINSSIAKGNRDRHTFQTIENVEQVERMRMN